MEKICTPFGCNPRNFFMQDMFGLRQEDVPIQEFSEEYHNILDYATAQGYTKPAYTIQVEQNQLLVKFKTSGIWDKLDVFYNFLTKQSIEDFAKINWKNPNQYYLTKVGGVTYIAKSGFKGAVGGYLNTDYAPGVRYLSGDAGFFGDIDTPQVGSMMMGVDDGSNETSLQFIGGTEVIAFVNNAVTGNIVTTPLSAFYHCYYSDTAVAIYKNGASIAQVDRLAPVSPVDPFYLLARNNNGVSDSHCTGTLACAGIGASLDGIWVDLYNAWVTYKQTVVAIAAYKAIIDYATLQGYTLPSQVVQDQSEILIYEYLIAGIWDELDVFYNFYTDGDENFAKINWKNPGTFQAVSVNGPTFAPFVGFSSDGLTSYLNSGIALSGLTKHQQNNAGIFSEVGGVDSNLAKCAYGVVDTGSSTRATKLSRESTGMNGQLNGGPASSFANYQNGSNFYRLVRSVATQVTLLLQSNETGQVGGVTANGRPNFNLFLLARNVNNTSIADYMNPDNSLEVLGIGSDLAAGVDSYAPWQYYKTMVVARQAWLNIINYATSQSYTLPSNKVQDKSLTLLYDLVQSGVWAELDVFYNANTDGDENFARINWKNPGTHQATEGTFTPMQGFDSLNTNWNPSVDGVNYTLDDASIIRDGSAEPNINAKYIYFNSVAVLSYADISVNSNPEPHGVTIQDNLYTVQRVSVDEVVLTQQGYDVATFDKTATSVPNEVLKFGSGLVRFVGAGSAMLDKVTVLNDILAKYKSQVK